MKKFYRQYVSILMAALCLAFTSCNQGIDAERGFGEVRVVIGGGAARAVDKGTGLPIFDDTNTKITVTDKDGNKLAEGTTSVTFQAAIGKKITVKAVVTAAAGQWRGSAEHTVTEGTNIVALKLSKAPKSMGNILIEVNDTGDSCTLKMASGKELVSKAWINTHHGMYPITARDKIGRVYVLYKDTSHGLQVHLKRFDVEGTEDTEFETTFMNMLSSHNSTGVTIDNIDTIAIDAKNNNIFLFYGGQVVCINETEPSAFGHSTLPASISSISAAAAYNGTLFFTVSPSAFGASGMKNKLVAVKAELSDSSLTLSNKIEMELPKLRTAGAFSSYLTNCTGLFADESGVYCLLSEQNLENFDRGTLYALGQIIRYQYSGSAFTDETKIGLNSKAAGTDGIPFDARYFSAPVGFIGYDEENIYIADDGFNIEYLNENWRTNGNKNRIAAFNRNTKEITFTDTEATWYGQKPEYKYPDTKILLWENSHDITNFGMKYWLADNANTPLPTTPDEQFWFSIEQTAAPADVFCYDQDGNLYIQYNDYSGGNKYVRRFALKEDGTYDKAVAQDLNLGTSGTVDAIAVDVSNGKNYLYYYTKTPTNKKIERFKWDVSFVSGSKDTAYNISVPSTEKVTALAANKDGVFVAVKEQTLPATPYTLKVIKYKKASPYTSDGEITIVSASIAEDSHSYPDSYNEYDEAIYDLRIVDGVLYAITSKIEKGMKDNSGYQLDSFKNSSVLYKIAKTASFSGNAEKLAEKNPVPPEGTNPGAGYGFYRFIAVKPKKLVIASDGAWGKKGITASHVKANNNKVFEYDLDKNLLEEKDAGGAFSKELKRDPAASGFEWK